MSLSGKCLSQDVRWGIGGHSNAIPGAEEPWTLPKSLVLQISFSGIQKGIHVILEQVIKEKTACSKTVSCLLMNHLESHNEIDIGQ
jgi:hypothetical protein